MKIAPINVSGNFVSMLMFLLLFNNPVHKAWAGKPLSCNNSDIAAVTQEPSVGGAVSPGQAICPGSQPADLVLSGNTGNVIKWQKSTSGDFTTATDINSTSQVLSSNTIGALNQTTYFRAVVQNGASAPANSGSATITMKTVVPGLGAVSGFTLFAVNGAVTNVGVSNINGDVGTNMGEISGFGAPSVVIGNQHIDDPATGQAAVDLVSLYNAFMDTPGGTPHTAGFGVGETLTGGFYTVGGVASVTGSLTLDAQGDSGRIFIFRSGGAFTMGAGTTVILTNGALASNIFWIAAGAIEMGASTAMAGTIIANGAVSMGAGGTINGRMYSIAGAVSVNEITTVEAIGVGGVTSGSATVCPFSNGAVLTLEQNAGDVIKWQSSATSDFSSGVMDIENTTASLINPAINETTWFRAVVESNLCGEEQYSTVSELTVVATTWDGTGWDNGAPAAAIKIIFAGDAAIVSDMEACSCHVSGTSHVTVEAGHSLTITGAITIDPGAHLVVQSNANLVQVNDVQNSGNITLFRDSAPIVRLDHTLWSSPVTGSQTLLQFSPATLPNRFYRYNTISNSYLATMAGGTFPLAAAVAIRAPNNWPTTAAAYPGSFTGVPNNGNITFSLDSGGAGYNGIGNPYPSTVSGSAFVAANSALITGTLYFYAHTLSMDPQGQFPDGTNYAIWNPGMGGTPATAGAGGTGSDAQIPDGTIQVGQGFLVKASSAGNLAFNNAMRESNTDNQFFRNNYSDLRAENDIERHRFWLKFSGVGGALNTILIGYAQGATAGIDYGYDGLKFGGTGSELYSLIQGQGYSIQGRALPFDTGDVVPLGFKADTAGTFTVSIYNADGLFVGGQPIFLRDNLTSALHNIQTSPYSFFSAAGTFASRFELLYTGSTLGAANETIKGTMLSHNDGILSIKSGFIIDKVQIYDLQGRIIFEAAGIGNTDFQTAELNMKGQVLLVKITGRDIQTTTKIIL